ncbi:hypothetical protein WN944_012618 [Citrus x changshan-huyou]|uniref:Non-specific lipid-transfer protein n=1 Tax=Citrus x changshan-huyou TaxID=2935761 RepID=A0AAP0MVH3_9ROSI
MARCLLAFGLVILVLAVSASRVHAMSCSEAVTTLMPCVPFVVGSDPRPTASCCLGVKTVNDQATTKEDRRALCECLKKAGPALGAKPEKAKQLPGLCGIKVPVPIDPNIDCNNNCAVSEDNHLASTFLNALRSSDRTGHGSVKADKAGLQSAYSIRFPFGPDADCTKPNFSLYLLGY